MKERLLDIIVCPKDEGRLSLEAIHWEEKECLEGKLHCETCSEQYPIVDAIPRFVKADHYTQNFGYQWLKYRQTQLDSFSGQSISRDRFNSVVGWKEELQGKTGLEVGCGAGRFTEIAAESGIELVTLDASRAVEANFQNNKKFNNVHFIQADLYNLPFKKHQFDHVYCLGVIQHTPSPEETFESLLKMVKENGGELAFDIYAKIWDTWLWSKYWFRPFLKGMQNDRLFQLIEKWTPFLIRVHDVLRFIPFIGRRLAHRVVPVCNYKYSFPFTKQQNIEWATLDTFDMFSPEHDHPRSLEEVGEWLEKLNLSEKQLEYGPNGIIGRIKFPIKSENL